jgi:hypothetical protein
LGFLSSVGFVPGKVADTILSQLLHAGAKVELLKRRQTSHSLGSPAERELGLELDKTQQSSDWGSILASEMVEYAAKDGWTEPPSPRPVFLSTLRPGMD